MTKSLTAGIALVLLGSVLVGCAGVQSQKQRESLDVTVNNFRQMIRWGAYDRAAAYRRSPTDVLLAPDLRELENIRVVSYEITDQAIREDGTTAVVNAIVSYYSDETGTVYNTRYVQNWWYDPKLERWFLNGDLPSFAEARPAIRLTPDR
jgi:hypothetical protein